MRGWPRASWAARVRKRSRLPRALAEILLGTQEFGLDLLKGSAMSQGAETFLQFGRGGRALQVLAVHGHDRFGLGRDSLFVREMDRSGLVVPVDRKLHQGRGRAMVKDSLGARGQGVGVEQGSIFQAFHTRAERAAALRFGRHHEEVLVASRKPGVSRPAGRPVTSAAPPARSSAFTLAHQNQVLGCSNRKILGITRVG